MPDCKKYLAVLLVFILLLQTFNFSAMGMQGANSGVIRENVSRENRMAGNGDWSSASGSTGQTGNSGQSDNIGQNAINPAGGAGTEEMAIEPPASAIEAVKQSAPAVQTTASAIAIPRNVEVIPGEQSLTVSWDAVEGAEGYDISLNGSITRAAAASRTYSSLKSGTQYFVRVRAISKAYAGEWSREVNKYTLLAAPARLRANQSNTSIELTWEASPGADSYRIYRNGVEIGGSDTNAYEDMILEQFSSCTYKVKAYSRNGNMSGFSSELIVTSGKLQAAMEEAADREALDKDTSVKDAPDKETSANEASNKEETPPVIMDTDIPADTNEAEPDKTVTTSNDSVFLSKPINIMATPSAISVDLSWKTAAGATGYEIYRDNIKVGTTAANTYTDTGLTAGKTYVYNIKAYNETGNESVLSEPLMVSTPALQLNIPGNVSAAAADRTLTVSFDAVEGAESYDISINGDITNTAQNRFVFNELSQNILYSIKVRAVNAGGCGEWSTGVEKYTLLSTPVNITATPSAISIDLSWEAVVGATRYEIYRDDVLITTTSDVIYADKGLADGQAYVYKIKAYNEAGNESALSNPLTVSTIAATYIKSNLTLTEDKIFGDVYLSGGTLNLAGHKLEVKGKLIQSGGVLNVNGGQLIIAGDYRIQKETKQSDGSVTYAGSSGYLYMNNTADYIYVGGSFVTQADSSGGKTNLTAGVMEVKGDFIQKNSYYTENFYASQTHKVLLSGDTVQTINFERPDYNQFNDLEIKHPEGVEVIFQSSFNVSNKLITNGCKIPEITILYKNWTLDSDQVLKGNLFLASSTLDLAGHKLEVKGKLIQSGGKLNVNGGQLIIAGDYRIQKETKQSDGSVTYAGSSGYLYMNNTADYIYVGGSFVTQAYYEHKERLTAGVMEVKGDFIQKQYSSSNNFYASGTHKVILSGDTVQNISFEASASSFFNDLEIKHPEGVGIEIQSNLNVKGKFVTNGCILPALTMSPANWTLTSDEVINGDLFLASSTLDLTGHKLEVKGKLIQSGGSLKINGGQLIIAGDYRIQKETKQSDGSVTYAGSSGYLYMNNTADYIYVGGSFVTQAYYEHKERLTAGVMEVKGDFIQKQYSSSNNFYASGTHKVILSGDTVQNISFEASASSFFNDLEIKHPEGVGIEIQSNLNVKGKFVTNGCILPALTMSPANWTLTSDEVINGDLFLASSTLDLTGHKLEVKGKLIQSGGSLKINGGQLIIAGDYRIQKETKQSDGSVTYAGSSGYLYMNNTADYIYVGGSFVTQAYYEHKERLTAGVMEVKGDFIQKQYSSSYNFYASGTHKVILSADTIQNVSFQNPGSSKLNILIITKPIDSGYTFNSYKIWNILIEDYRYEQYFGLSGMNPATGNFSRTYTDLTMDSPGYDIDFSRTYNSRSDKTSVFGRGWAFSYEGSVQDSLYSADTKEVRLPDGSVQTFKMNSDGTFAANDSHNTLVQNPDGTYTLTSKQQDIFYFDSNGHLVEMQDKNGNSVTVSVDSEGRVQGVTDQAGRNFTVTYENGLIKSIKDNTGNRTITYEYLDDRLVKVTDAMGNATSYTYDSEGFMTEVSDSFYKLIESVTYIHDGENKDKVEKRTDANGNEFTYSYDNINCVTTITDSNGRVTTQKYDSSYSIINSTDAEGKSTVYEYTRDENGINKYSEEKSVTDRNGNKTQYDRDANGNVTKITNPDSSTRVMTYDEKNNVTSQKDENGKMTFYVYDSGKKNLIKKVQPLNGTDQYTDGSSDPEKFAITSYEYYTDSEGAALGYKAKGLLKSVTDPESNTTVYTYDTYGNIITETDAENNTRTNEYDASSRLVKSTTPNGNNTGYVYDKNGNLERQVTDGGETTRITYDSEGRKIKEISPKLYDPSEDDIQNHRYTGDAGYRYTYFDNGKVRTVTDPNNNTTSYTYDIYGNVVTETKPNGAKYTYQYDLLNRPLRIYFQEDSMAEQILLEENTYQVLAGGKTQQTHKKYLNDTEVAVTVSVFDYAGRQISETRPDGTTISTTYNANGTVNYTTDAKGNVTYYKYDGLNRLTEKWTPFETVSGSTRFTYNSTVYGKAGEVRQETIGKDAVLKDGKPAQLVTKTYEYYKNGKIKNVTDNEGRKTEYQYDADGNTSQEKVYTDTENYIVTDYRYNHLGKVAEKTEYIKAGDLEGNDINSTGDVSVITAYTYDQNGNLETMTTPDNVTTTYTYDNMNNQTGVSRPGMDEYGNQTNISSSTKYDWQGQPIEKIDSNGNITTYTYDQRGLLVRTTDAANNTTAFYYDRAGRKTAEVAPNAYDSSKTIDQMNRVEYTYDLMDRIKTKTYAGEEKRLDTDTHQWTTRQVRIVQEAYKYDNNGNPVKVLDGLGFEAATDKTGIDIQINTGYGTEYTYNLANKPITVLDPVSKERRLSFTTKYSYDALGHKTSKTNAKGVITNYYYDDAGNITQIGVRKTLTAAETVLKTSTYDYLGNLLTETDAIENTTTYQYNALGKVRRAVYPGDATIPQNEITCQYDVMGRLKIQKDTKGAVDTYTYNNQGDILTHTQQAQDGSEAITTGSRYDKNGNVRYSTDANGNEKEYIYNHQNKLISARQTVLGVSRETSFMYDANGNKTAETDWRGNTTTSIYDGLNRLIGQKDAYSHSIQKLEYNHNNVQEKAYDALNQTTQYTYDKNNRLLTTTDSEGHTTSQTYDELGNIATKKDGRNNQTTYQYDEYNRLNKVTNAKNESTEYSYDLNGNLLTQKDAKGNITTYEYNAANKVSKRIDQGGRTGTPGNYSYNPAKTETSTYNADGTLSAKTDRNGKTINYTYDIHGRLLTQTIGSETITYTYDGNGNQLTMTDSTGTTVRTYDELNRVTAKTVPNIGKSLYEYDIITGMEPGCWEENTTDPKGNVTTKEYDRAGRLKAVTADGKTTTYSYLDNGARESVVYSGGAREDYTYYADGLLHTLTNKKADGSVIDTYSYTYDAAHNQITKTDAKGTTSYTYDVLNRLETVTEPNGTKTTYTYDKAGNRETETVKLGSNTALNTYSYNEQNRLMQITTKQNGTLATTTVYTYDNNGNQLTTTVNGTVTVTNNYDNRNQLIRTITGSITVENLYNGDGYRVEKRVNGAITRYLYDYDKVVLEVDQSGSQKARNIYGTNLLMRTADGTTYYYMYNGHADVTALLRPDGTIAATYYYDAFGNITDTTGSASNSITYAGYQYDKETGLYYLNARMYDPKTARFLQEDTYLGDRNDPLSLNLYTYCHNEPIMYTDPTGHVTMKVGSKGDGVVAIQEMLQKLGYNVGKADGSFGSKTEAAIKQFQNDYKIKSDGIVGNQTLTYLKSTSATVNAPDYAKEAAIQSASKAKSGGISDKTILMSNTTFNNTLNQISSLQKATGGVVKTDVKDGKVVITGVTPKSSPAVSNNSSSVSKNGNQGTGKSSSWMNSTTPPFAKYGVPEIPTTAQLVNGVVENTIKKVLPETISSNVLNGINSTLDKAGEIEKKVTAYLDPDGHTISQFAPEGNIDTMKPYGKITKVGTAMTVVSNGLDIANTWTANSGNTNLQRIGKTGIQTGGMVIASAWGSATVSIAVASGFVEPETGGLSTAGIVFAGTLDVGGAAVINWGQDKLYKLTGIK